jgi:branched-chain amino acid transport system substrate-binding protein
LEDDMKTWKTAASAVALALGFGLAGNAFAQAAQGVTKDEIVIGTIQDLSGPIVALGKPLRAGMQMRVDEANENGGINGRRLKLVVEDSGYDPKKGVLATQKLLQKDRIFAMVGTLGTPIVLTSMPLVLDKGVLHLFPLTAARETYEPLHKLKFSSAATYFDQMRAGIPYMVKQKGYKKVGILYQDDEFGAEVLRGTEQGLKDIGMALAEKTSYKRGATDFASQVAKLKGAGCDLVILGTVFRETIGSIAEARKTGFNADFFGTSALYTRLIHALGGPAMNGLYGMSTVSEPYPDDASKNLRAWVASYKTRAGEDPTVFSVYGYTVIDYFVKALEKAGPNPTQLKVADVLESMKTTRDMFGSPEYAMSKTNHLATDKSRISQIQNGRWVQVSDYLAPTK